MIETLRGDLDCHRGAPDKTPERRLATLEAAGELAIPFTTGILVGIGEDRADRIAALEAIADSHRRHGHVQEVIVQNFLPKPGTAMHAEPPCPPEDYLEAIALARLILPPDVHLQAPPNLSDDFGVLLDAGIDDWGGVSPVTADHVNPERPWPDLDRLRQVTEARGFVLAPRLTAHPEFVLDPDRWFDPAAALRGDGPLRRRGPRARRSRRGVRAAPHGPPRPSRSTTAWRSCRSDLGRPPGTRAPTRPRPSSCLPPPGPPARWPRCSTASCSASRWASTRSSPSSRPGDPRWRRWPRWPTSCAGPRWATSSPTSTTATSTTPTCAPSSAGSAASARARCRSTCGAPRTCCTLDDIAERTREAAELGATEVCLQGGIHPDFDGDYYIDVTRAVKDAVPDIHVHGFTALEVTEGAKRLGEPLDRVPAAADGRRSADPARARRPRSSTTRSAPSSAPTRSTPTSGSRPTAPPTRSGCAPTSPSCSAPSSSPCTGLATSCAPGTCRPRPVASPSSCPCRSCTWPPRSTSSTRPDAGPTFREVAADARRAAHRLPRAHRQHPDLVGEARARPGPARRCRPGSTIWAAR